MAETRPRAGLLAGQERARRGAVVGDGGAGVRGGTKLREFIGENFSQVSSLLVVGKQYTIRKALE